MFYQIDPIWSGKTVAIIAGGESVTARLIRHVAIARLEDRCRVIAVNDAFYLAWWADLLHGYDAKWWKWNVDRTQHFPGLKTTVDTSVPHPWVTGYLNRTAKHGFDPDPHCVRGSNSGYQAVHIAIHAAASRILLLGFDMQGDHWFGSHPDGRYADLNDMAKEFSALAAVADERKIQVVNCSPSSTITCFPKGDLEALL